MVYDFHELNERMVQLPLHERPLMQVLIDALRARSCFRHHDCGLQARASATYDAYLGAKCEWLANFARRITISIDNELAAMNDEMGRGAIIEGEYKEVDPEPLAGLFLEHSTEELPQ